MKKKLGPLKPTTCQDQILLGNKKDTISLNDIIRKGIDSPLIKGEINEEIQNLEYNQIQKKEMELSTTNSDNKVNEQNIDNKNCLVPIPKLNLPNIKSKSVHQANSIISSNEKVILIPLQETINQNNCITDLLNDQGNDINQNAKQNRKSLGDAPNINLNGKNEKKCTYKNPFHEKQKVELNETNVNITPKEIQDYKILEPLLIEKASIQKIDIISKAPLVFSDERINKDRGSRSIDEIKNQINIGKRNYYEEDDKNDLNLQKIQREIEKNEDTKNNFSQDFKKNNSIDFGEVISISPKIKPNHEAKPNNPKEVSNPDQLEFFDGKIYELKNEKLNFNIKNLPNNLKDYNETDICLPVKQKINNNGINRALYQASQSNLKISELPKNYDPAINH